jgi:hypothetical protein
MTPHIKMFVSDWFTDELGNKTRIIKIRDCSALLRIEPGWGSCSDALAAGGQADVRRGIWMIVEATNDPSRASA